MVMYNQKFLHLKYILIKSLLPPQLQPINKFLTVPNTGLNEYRISQTIKDTNLPNKNMYPNLKQNTSDYLNFISEVSAFNFNYNQV